MNFIDQLKQEVQIHGDMETEFRSRRYRHGRELARTYVDMIEEKARIAARNGDYEQLEGRAVISGWCPLAEKDFEEPFFQTETKRAFISGKKRITYALVPDNELFDVFLSSFRSFCYQEGIIFFPFQAQILTKGVLCYHTLPFTIGKRDKVQSFGFPYQIEF